jgi:outer membrane protein OmpA-like peptidoglycan-associated protein
MNLTNGEIHIRTLSDKKGELLVCLPLDEEYALNISKEQYAFHSENVQLDQRTSIGDPMDLTVFLTMIEMNEPGLSADPIVLNNVFFESGSANLLAKSDYELKQLLQLLQINQRMMIEIRGHTDNVGSDSDNQQLSEKRAQSVYHYLVAAGVTKERLLYIGFGESVPIADNDTEDGRQRNRRTEFVILSNEKK